MIRPSAFFRIALHNLQRGGQRVVIAFLCVAFGVMSLSAMSILSERIGSLLLVDARRSFGGDLQLTPIQVDFFSFEALQPFQDLQRSGLIEAYTPIARNNFLVFHTKDSGELHFIPRGMGIDPDTYPLVGELTLTQPDSPADLLASPNTILITRDLVDKNNLSLGQVLVVSDLSVGAAIEVTIAGIVADTPDHTGGGVFYSFATAQTLAGQRDILNTVLLTSGQTEVVVEAFSQEWYTYSAGQNAGRNREEHEMFDLGLKGAGILGLIVGGIGVANTMQVLLRRRQRELAIFKTLGYTTRNLMTLFLIEALLLGLVGGLLGLILSIGCSYWLFMLFSRLTNFLINTTLFTAETGSILLTSGLVGLATTLIFSLYAIVNSAQVRPASLLRQENYLSVHQRWMQNTIFVLALGIPFGFLTTFIMGSLIEGIGILLFAFAGLLGLGGLLGGASWLIVRLLPVRWFPMLNMARTSFQRRGMGLIFAMIALFTGVISLGFAGVVIQSAEREVDEKALTIDGYNLAIISPYKDSSAVLATASNQAPLQQAIGYDTRISQVEVVGADQRSVHISPVLMARSEPHDFIVDGAPWGSAPNGVYVYEYSNIPVGTQVQITLLDGSQKSLEVAGSYAITYGPTSFRFEAGLLLPAETSLQITDPDSMTVFLKMDEKHITAASAALGTALPQSTVINLVAYAARFTQTYRNLFLFAVSMASLSLLAGILLIANAASLAILDRRYELGVLKAIGYSRWQLLTALNIEYLLVSLLASLLGLAGIQIFLLIIAQVNGLAGNILRLEPLTAVLIALSSAGLTLLTVLSVAWQPVQVSPSITLNDRN